MNRIVWSLLIIFSFSPAAVLANPWGEVIKLDGAISFAELHEDKTLKPVAGDDFVIIREAKDFFYVAVRTDVQTIVNGYYRSANEFKIMHASAALGEAHYHLTNGKWLRDREKFDWIYRDPNFWDKKHPNGEDSQLSFYQRFGWTANTVSMGSYREMEMIISKKLLPDVSKLQLSYSRNINGTKSLALFPEDKSLTGDNKIDLKLHQGELRETLEL